MNRKIIALLSAAMVLPMAASNLKVDIDKSHNLWWNAPETPVLNLSLTDTTGAAPASQLRVYLTIDRMPSKIVFDKSFEIKGYDSLSVEVPIFKPGFYLCHIQDDGNTIEEKWIGYEPSNVVSLPDSKPDFEEFWEKAGHSQMSVAGANQNSTLTRYM